MPEGMPANISKGFLLEAIDNKLDNASEPDLLAIRSELVATPKLRLPVILRNALGGTPPVVRGPDINHLRNDWFGTDTKPIGRANDIWWRELQPIDPIIRQGFIEVINKIIASIGNPPRLKVDFYWVCAGHSIEFVICEKNAVQLTVLIMTPSPPNSRRMPQPPDEANYEFTNAVDPITIIRPPASGEAEVRVPPVVPPDHVRVQPKSVRPK